MTYYSRSVLLDDPIRYYRLDETSGTVANDMGTQGQNGTISGGVTLGQQGLLTDDPDTAMLFDGTTGQIALPTTGLPTGANPWSIEAWVKTGVSLPGSSSVIFSFGSNVANEVATLFFSTASNGFKIDLFGGGSAAGPAATTNTIYHLVAVFDGISLFLYQNGVLVSGPILATCNIVAGSAFIAQSITGLARWNNIVDEVALYNYALSSLRVNRHYTDGSARTIIGPAAWNAGPGTFVSQGLGIVTGAN